MLIQSVKIVIGGKTSESVQKGLKEVQNNPLCIYPRCSKTN